MPFGDGVWRSEAVIEMSAGPGHWSVSSNGPCLRVFLASKSVKTNDPASNGLDRGIFRTQPAFFKRVQFHDTDYQGIYLSMDRRSWRWSEKGIRCGLRVRLGTSRRERERERTWPSGHWPSSVESNNLLDSTKCWVDSRAARPIQYNDTYA